VYPLSESLVAMSAKTVFKCDCCGRESDDAIGWSHVSVNGKDAANRQVLPDALTDLCEICWSPLQAQLDRLRETAARRHQTN